MMTYPSLMSFILIIIGSLSVYFSFNLHEFKIINDNEDRLMSLGGILIGLGAALISLSLQQQFDKSKSDQEDAIKLYTDLNISMRYASDIVNRINKIGNLDPYVLHIDKVCREGSDSDLPSLSNDLNHIIVNISGMNHDYSIVIRDNRNMFLRLDPLIESFLSDIYYNTSDDFQEANNYKEIFSDDDFHKKSDKSDAGISVLPMTCEKLLEVKIILSQMLTDTTINYNLSCIVASVVSEGSVNKMFQKKVVQFLNSKLVKGNTLTVADIVSFSKEYAVGNNHCNEMVRVFRLDLFDFLRK